MPDLRHAQQVALVVDGRNARQRLVIERRYGLNGCEVTTLEDLAAEIGVTRERVRQIQGEALDKLRAKLERRGYTRDALF